MGQCRFRQPLSSKFIAKTLNGLIIAMVAIGLLAFFNPGAAADAPQPAKKDTPRAIKSKNAVFTASVEPAEARPGETVTFKVTAKLDPGFHVYKHSKTQGPGPINTSFDF